MEAVIEHLLVLFFLGVVFGLPAWITWKKGQRMAFLLGFLLPSIVWWIAAFRLGHPTSWWARRFYGPTKTQRARDRFGVEAE